MPVRNDIPVLINGVAHDWASITLNIMGQSIAGVTKITYSEEQTVENNYGAGNLPVSRGYGQINPTGSITLLGETVAALELLSPSGRLQDLGMFPIIVAYVPKGGLRRVHRLTRCEFTGNSRDVSTGDTKIEVEVPLIIGEIKWR